MPRIIFYALKKTYLQATSMASFKWHLAVNETRFLPLSLPGICASISEAVVRSRAERESGEEWKTLRGRASRRQTGERNLPAAGGHSALSIRSRHSTPLCVLSQELQRQSAGHFTGAFTL